MIIDFRLSQQSYSDLDDIFEIVKARLQEVEDTHNANRIGYVAGKVTADSLDGIMPNLDRLRAYTKQVSESEHVPVFSAADIFCSDVYWRLNLPHPNHEDEFYNFWRQVLGSGITDVYMTPEWERSLGASDEYKRSVELNLNIHFI